MKDPDTLPRINHTFDAEGHPTLEFASRQGGRISVRRSYVVAWQEVDHRSVLFTLIGNFLADHPYDEINEVLQ